MARSFDGAGQYLSAPHSATLAVAAPMALGCWINAASSPGNFKYLISKLLLAGEHPSWGFGTDGSGNLRFLIGHGTSSGQVVASGPVGSTVWDGAWHHLLGTYDGSTVAVYLDGGLENSASLSSPVAYDTGLGLYVGAFDGSGLYYTGSLAEVALWSAVPSAGDRAALVAGVSPTKIRPDQVAGYWPLIGRTDPDPDLLGGVGLTVTGATAAAHCRVYGGATTQVTPLSTDPEPEPDPAPTGTVGSGKRGLVPMDTLLGTPGARRWQRRSGRW